MRSERRIVVFVLFQVDFRLFGTLLSLRSLRRRVSIIVLSFELRPLSVSCVWSTATGSPSTCFLLTTVAIATTSASAASWTFISLLNLRGFFLSALLLLGFLKLNRELQLLDFFLHRTFTVLLIPLLLLSDFNQFLI